VHPPPVSSVQKQEQLGTRLVNEGDGQRDNPFECVWTWKENYNKQTKKRVYSVVIEFRSRRAADRNCVETSGNKHIAELG
jgi:hypothetical protein